MSKIRKGLFNLLILFGYAVPIYFFAACARSYYIGEPGLIISSYFSTAFMFSAIHWYNHVMDKQRNSFCKRMKNISDGYNHVMEKQRNSFCKRMKNISDEQWKLVENWHDRVAVYEKRLKKAEDGRVTTGFELKTQAYDPHEFAANIEKSDDKNLSKG